MSAALPLGLPGLTVDRRPCASSLAIRVRQHIDMLAWRVGGTLAARQIRRATLSPDPAELERTAARLRARFHKLSELPVSFMNQMTAGISQQRLAHDLVRFTWMGEGGSNDEAAILYVPGGSFVIDRSPHVTALVCGIAKQAGLPVLTCDYRLAPEHPCPAAIDDVAEALRFMMVSCGVAPRNIAIVAESAGAAIALAAAQRLASDGVLLGALAFLSPWVDLTLSNVGVNDLTHICAELYLGKSSAGDPVASPIFGHFEGLPPMIIHGARCDPLFGDGVALSKTAARAGIDVTLRAWDGGTHVFERYFGKDSDRSVTEVASFLRSRLLVPRKAA